MLNLESTLKDHKVELKKWIKELDNQDHLITESNAGLNALGLNGNACLTYKVNNLFKEIVWSLEEYPELIDYITSDKNWYELFIEFLKQNYSNLFKDVVDWIRYNDNTIKLYTLESRSDITWHTLKGLFDLILDEGLLYFERMIIISKDVPISLIRHSSIDHPCMISSEAREFVNQKYPLD